MVSQLIAEAAPNVDAAAHPIQLLRASAGHAFLCRIFNISSGLAAECVLPISCRWRPVLPALPPGAVSECAPFRLLNQTEYHLPRFVNSDAILQQKLELGIIMSRHTQKRRYPACPLALPSSQVVAGKRAKRCGRDHEVEHCMLLGYLCLTKLPERMSPETACMLAAFTCSAGRPEGGRSDSRPTSLHPEPSRSSRTRSILNSRSLPGRVRQRTKTGSGTI